MDVFIPMPVQMVIDDVGWRRGWDGHEEEQPFRTGIEREHEPEDYLAIVELGKRLGMRPQAAFILAEWDTRNLLRRIPTTSWMGEKWDNSGNVGAWMEKSAEIIAANSRHIEVTLHGVHHEYWQEGKMSRAEWHDVDRKMRPRGEVLARLELFMELLEQHKLAPRPTSFVPAAFYHHFGHPENNLAEILAGFGITSINTPFHTMRRSVEVQSTCEEAADPHPSPLPAYRERERTTGETPVPRDSRTSYQTALFGFDHGVMTIDRGRDLFNWRVIEPEPVEAPTGPTCGMHWPQLLHRDPKRNAEVVDRWVGVLSALNERPDRMLAPDTPAFCTQLAHHVLSRVTVADGVVEIDARGFFASAWGGRGREPLVVKVRSETAPMLRDERGRPIPPRRGAKANESLYTFDLPLEASQPLRKLRLEKREG